MNPAEAFRHFGLAAIVVFWVAVLLVFRKWGVVRSSSISSHLVAQRKAYVIFALASGISQGLFLLFIFNLFAPHFQFGRFFEYLMAVGTLGYAAAAVFPDTKGISHQAHLVGAWTMACSMLIGVFLLAASNHMENPVRWLALSLGVTMVGLLGTAFLLDHVKTHYLSYQATYLVCFHSAILITVYVR